MMIKVLYIVNPLIMKKIIVVMRYPKILKMIYVIRVWKKKNNNNKLKNNKYKKKKNNNKLKNNNNKLKKNKIL